MKFLCTSDWHTRITNPRYRTDNYYESLMKKIGWIFDLADEEQCTAILHGGDLCDSPDQSNNVKVDIIKLCHKYKISLYIIAGQHDLLYRKFSNTTLAVLAEAGVVTILNSDPIIYDDNINIYGASWEEEIPEVIDKDATNILLIHKMIVQDKPLWPGQTDYTTAKSTLLKYADYYLIVSGDNHNSFMATTTTEKKQGSVLLNCGSLMRTTVAQREHRPCIWIYDVDLHSFKQHFIPIAPIEDVMDLETADEIKEKNEALEAFMEGLSSDYSIELNFEENLKNLMIENKTDNRIKKLGNSFLEKYYEGGIR